MSVIVSEGDDESQYFEEDSEEESNYDCENGDGLA